MGRMVWKVAAPVALSLAVVASTGGQPAAASTSTGGLIPTLLQTVTGTVTGTVSGLLSGTTGVIDSLWGDDATQEGVQASQGPGGWDARLDQGSMYSLTTSVGAQKAWATGATGKGVTVALVDTGVAPVKGLDSDGKVYDGPDLSYEGQQDGTRYLDGYGHGTHMAGIIAGKDAGFDPQRPDPTLFAGVAPDASLLNMKVAAGDGGSDVSQVIAALDWIAQHHDDAGMDVRVVNLSYGTESLQPWQVDPLARAVENVWNAGILVVVAVGNNGLAESHLLMPAIDPHVLAVGAVDHKGTARTGDDVVAAFTNGGSSTRRPDLLAPGKSVVSLRVPNSYVDTFHPEGRVPGDLAQRYFRGSGTSQASAVVSGEAALLFQANPRLTPDQAKSILTATAHPLVADRSAAQGAGVTDAAAAVSMARSRLALPATSSLTTASSGLGSLEASRGGEHVVDPENGVELSGEVDAMGAPWVPRTWVAAQRAGTAWIGGTWNGRTWTGTGWAGRDFQPAAWTGTSWSGLPWASHTWSSDVWQARSWRGGDWQARSWREESWSARSWRELD
jgi:serine protease AprX